MFKLPEIALISHTSKIMLKILPARLQQYVNQKLPYVQARFRKGRGTRGTKFQHSLYHRKRREFQKQTFFCFIDYVKAFDCVDHNKLWKILKEVGIPVHLMCFLRTYMQINKQQWEMDMEKWTGSKSIKGNNKVLYCHLLIYFLCRVENNGISYAVWNARWMKHKLESRLLSEISTTLDMKIPLKWPKVKRN